MSTYVLSCNDQVKLPFINGMGEMIDLELGTKYTITHRGGYYLALRNGETESVRPANMPVKIKSDNSNVIQLKRRG